MSPMFCSSSVAPLKRWFFVTRSATFKSISRFFSSSTMKSKSNLLSSESGSPMFFVGGRSSWYSPYIGFEAAKTLHRAFKEQWIPALAIVTVCYSITSWIATRSDSFILSNSSIKIIPPSASTIAPASRLVSPVSWSFFTAAVSPTLEVPRPVVLIASGAVPMTYRKSCDLAVEGSPISRMLMSPLRCVPVSRFFSLPPSSWRRMACLIIS